MNPFIRLISGMMAAVLVFLFPLQYLAQMQSESVDDFVSSRVTEFTDTARHQGSITVDMYEDLVGDLDSTGELYDISIETSHPVTGKEMADNLHDTIGDYGTVNLSYMGKTTGSKFKTASEISLFAAHSHTSDCYAGNLHVCNGTDCVYSTNTVLVRIGYPSNGESYGILQSSMNGGITWTTYITLPAGVGFTEVTYGNGMYIAFTSDASYYYSYDGGTWTKATDKLFSFPVRAVIYKNNRFYALASYAQGISYNTYYYFALTSSDGLTWQLSSGPYAFDKPLESMKLVNGIALILLKDSFNFYYSPIEGINMFLYGYSFSNGTPYGVYDFEYYNGTYYSLFDRLRYSTSYTQKWTDGYWFYSTGAPGSPLTNMISFNGSLYLFGAGKVFKSVPNTSAYDYTLLPLYLKAISDLPVYSNTRLPITYDGRVFYLSANNGCVYTSKDFTSWNTLYTASNINTTKMAVSANNGYGDVTAILGPCLKIGKYYDSNGNEVFPICDTVVTSITPTNPTQSIYTGGSIITTATATYLDGHTGTVSCTATGFNTNVAGTQTVTLTYYGLVNNAKTTGTKTCTLTVTVQQKSKQCIAGLGHPDYDASLSACPVCTAISKITAVDENHVYDGNHHELNITNNSGCYIDVGYDIDPTEGITWQWNQGPSAPGSYPVVFIVYVYNSLSGTAPGYIVFYRTIKVVKSCTAGLGHPNYDPYLPACPVCTAISKITANDQTFLYDGNHHELSYTNNSGCSVAVGYDWDPTEGTEWHWDQIGPTAPGSYPAIFIVEVYNSLTGTSKVYEAFYRMITIVNHVTNINVTPSSSTVYNGTEPTYIVKVNYGDGSSKTLNSSQYTMTGWTTGPGTKSVTFSYTENNKTATATVSIKVLPNITSITVTPVTQNVARYSGTPSLSVKALYEDNTYQMVTGFTLTGLNTSNLGSQSVTVSYTENNITVRAYITVIVNKLTTVCPICGSMYELDANDMDQGCLICAAKTVSLIVSPSSVSINKSQSLPITVTAVSQNGKTNVITGWTSDYNPNIIGIQDVTVSYEGASAVISVNTQPSQATCPICGILYSLNDDGTDPGCPVCSKQVISINVSEESVVIQRHQPLPITVSAKYKDGHTASIADWVTDFIPDITGTNNVTIYYQEAFDTVIVQVIDEGYTVCPYCGLEYDKSDSPYGCPVCSKTIVGITAALRTGGTQVIYKSQLNLQINLTYKDTHKMVTYTGYTVQGYAPDQLGQQNITIFYQSFSTSLLIEVVDGPKKVVCPYGHEYYLNEDGTDPGCPICAGASSIEEAIFYFETSYTSEILSSLYANGIYKLKKGDYLTVTISHRDVSVRTRLQKMFFSTNIGVMKRKYTYGGEVL